MKEKIQERQIAIKTKIKEINEGNYVIKEGWEPNHLLTKSKIKISRVNLMAIVLDKESQGEIMSLVLDDGSGKIVLRSFEKIKNLETINIGESVLIIGKVREYNNEKYVAPEIIKKIDTKWLKVRSLELKETKEEQEIQKEELKEEDNENTKNKEPLSVSENEPVKIEEETFESVNEKIIELIKKLDKGEGALIEEVKEKVNTSDSEEIIEKMLKEGEIFQNLPGRIKVL
ncbi:OB-fold nucleic acid binding domain-containing protein [Nanoarchaeota archaeon]